MRSHVLRDSLIDATTRLCTWPFEKWEALGADPWNEEVGSPDDFERGGYVAVEALVVDRFMDETTEVLHITVAASDFERELGTDFFIYADGRLSWDRVVWENVGGVPRLLDS